jgi:hypothetical protein
MPALIGLRRVYLASIPNLRTLAPDARRLLFLDRGGSFRIGDDDVLLLLLLD